MIQIHITGYNDHRKTNNEEAMRDRPIQETDVKLTYIVFLYAHYIVFTDFAFTSGGVFAGSQLDLRRSLG